MVLITIKDAMEEFFHEFSEMEKNDRDVLESKRKAGNHAKNARKIFLDVIKRIIVENDLTMRVDENYNHNFTYRHDDYDRCEFHVNVMTSSMKEIITLANNLPDTFDYEPTSLNCDRVLEFSIYYRGS